MDNDVDLTTALSAVPWIAIAPIAAVLTLAAVISRIPCATGLSRVSDRGNLHTPWSHVRGINDENDWISTLGLDHRDSNRVVERRREDAEPNLRLRIVEAIGDGESDRQSLAVIGRDDHGIRMYAGIARERHGQPESA